MFNMSGHKITICGVFPPTPQQEAVRDAEGVDVSDIGQIQEAAGILSLTPEDISVAVWAEDLARVPILVWDADGELIYEDGDVFTEEDMIRVRVAVGLIVDAVEAEQKAAQAA